MSEGVTAGFLDVQRQEAEEKAVYKKTALVSCLRTNKSIPEERAPLFLAAH